MHTIPHFRVLCAVLGLLLGLGTPTRAQYTASQLQEVRSTVSVSGEAIRSQYPGAWVAAHNGQEPSGSEFVRRWALDLRARGVLVCVNGKRGSDTLSQDVLVFPVTEGGNRDTSGRYSRIAIIDLIVGAGGANPRLDWADVSAASPGKCIDPWLEPGEGPPGPGPGPGPTPEPSPDLKEVVAALARIEGRLAAIEAKPPPPPIVQVPGLEAIEAYVDAMVGSGPAGDPATLPNHITDLKQRLDVLRVMLEQLTAWLRSRALLRY